MASLKQLVSMGVLKAEDGATGAKPGADLRSSEPEGFLAMDLRLYCSRGVWYTTRPRDVKFPAHLSPYRSRALYIFGSASRHGCG